MQRFDIPLFSREPGLGVLFDAVQRHLEKHTRAHRSLNPYFLFPLFSLLASEGRCRAAILISFLFCFMPLSIYLSYGSLVFSCRQVEHCIVLNLEKETEYSDVGNNGSRMTYHPSRLRPGLDGINSTALLDGSGEGHLSA